MCVILVWIVNSNVCWDYVIVWKCLDWLDWDPFVQILSINRMLSANVYFSHVSINIYGSFGHKSLKLAHPSLRLKTRDLRSYFWPLCLSPSIKVMSRWWCKTLVVWLKFTRGVLAMKGKMLLIFWCMLILGNCNMKCLLDSCLMSFRLPFIQLRERERERERVRGSIETWN